MTRTNDLVFTREAALDRTIGQVTFEQVGRSERWQALFASAPFPHSVQHFAYGEAKANHGWHVARLLVRHMDRPVAIVQTLERRVFGIRLVTRINRGPIFLSADPPRRSCWRSISRCKALGPVALWLLSIAPALTDGTENQRILADAGYRRRNEEYWASARIDLNQDADEIFRSFDSNWRNRIRAGLRRGVTVRTTDDDAHFDWMIERHLDNMRNKNFRGHGPAFLRALRRSFGSDLHLFQAIHESRPVAGLVIIKTGTLADGVVAWFGPDARQLKAGNVLAWRAIEEMQKRGCRTYDVGGTNAERGFSSFKSGMRGQSYALVGEYVSY